MISKKSVQCVIDHHKNQWIDCEERIAECEKEMRLGCFQKDQLKYNMANSKMQLLKGMASIHRQTVEDLESIIND